MRDVVYHELMHERPHLSDKYRLMLYVGALLKNLGRTNELASMLNAAKISKSEDQHVAAALKQLG